MNDMITYDQIIYIDKSILENSKSNEKNNILISEFIYKQYDLYDIRKKLLKLFSEFKSVRDFYIYDVETNITSNYETKTGSSNQVSNPVAKAIDEKFDKEVHATDLYKAVIKLSFKLTYEESIYLIGAFLEHKSEEKIAEILYITKPSLQKYKKSCIFKMWKDLSCLYER